jgi:hypothetical protein
MPLHTHFERGLPAGYTLFQCRSGLLLSCNVSWSFSAPHFKTVTLFMCLLLLFVWSMSSLYILLRRIYTYHAVPMPFSCHAVLLRVHIVSFPFDLHSAAVFDSHIPCLSPAMPRICILRQVRGMVAAGWRHANSVGTEWYWVNQTIASAV